MLLDTIKNLIYFGLGLLLASFIFMFSDGSGFLFYLAWFIGLVIAFIFILNLFKNGLLLLLGIFTIPLYFDRNENRKEKLILDFSNLIIVAFDLIMLTAAYQLFQQYGNLQLSEFKPFGIQFFYNFSY